MRIETKLHSFAKICFLFCAIFQQSAAAESIDCVNQRQHYLYWTQEYFELADAVFFGKVVAEEMPDPPVQLAISIDNAWSLTELLEQIQAAQSRAPSPDRSQTATFEIHKSWKGSVSPTIVVRMNLISDDTGYYAPFKIGDSYLVFVFNSDEEEIRKIPDGCASHELAENTASKIRVLDALTKKPGE